MKSMHFIDVFTLETKNFGLFADFNYKIVSSEDLSSFIH